MLRILSLAAAFSLTAGAALAGDADFMLANATGYPIRELYVSPSKSANWGSDILGKHTINDGEAWNITFAKTAACQQDLKIVFDDDASEVVWENFNLCDITKITLTYNRKSGETRAKTE